MPACDVRDDYEIIAGVKVTSPRPDMGHGNIIANLIATIGVYVKINRLGICFADNLDVHFPDGNLFRPDFVFVSAAQDRLFLDKRNMTLHGVPDMVAEIFSRSTMQRDTTVKKDIYERNGVREYWTIDPWRETVEIYLLRGGKYVFTDRYENYSEDELARLTDEERATVKLEVPVAILDGFTVKVKNIFGWYLE
ncbi:MAG: Uma2 family endonuclease [Selenomonadaceae bacterium]|nr:Uma2 family endonuclease [Selenomonadaceae bacterium]